MATAETVDMGKVNTSPTERHIKIFEAIEPELKKEVLRKRHTYSKHDRADFEAVSALSDSDLVAFSSADLVAVREAKSGYGEHLFGKVRIPSMADSGPAYIHFRAFEGNPPKFHAVHTEEKDEPDGGKTYRAIFTKDDELVWFNE